MKVKQVSDFPRYPNGKYIPYFKNLTGQNFNGIIVESFWGRDKKSSFWNCICLCGNEFVACYQSLKKEGNQTNCGCLTQTKRKNLKDHYSYSIWRAMNVRCNDPKDSRYDHYKNYLNVTVCEDWHWDNPDGFMNFYEWCQKNPRPEIFLENGQCAYSLDRIKNMNGDYSPKNCRWATRSEQNQNTEIYHGYVFSKSHQTWAQKKRTRSRNLLCDRWQDFKNFIADVGEVPENKFLSRKDVSQPFGPDNFIFTDSPQRKNKFNSHLWNLFLEK